MISRKFAYLALFLFPVKCFSGDNKICNLFNINNIEPTVLNLDGDIYVIATQRSILSGRIRNSDSLTAKLKISTAFDRYIRKREKWDYLQIATHGAIAYSLKCGESKNFVTEISLKDIIVKKLKRTGNEIAQQHFQDLNFQDEGVEDFDQFK